MKPEIKYVRSGEVSLAYSVVGSGPPDLVWCGVGWISHLELDWEEPAHQHMFERLASFSRLIQYDSRGAGLSDRTVEQPTVEEDARDLLAILDDAGSSRPFIAGAGQGGMTALYFAATYPDRCTAVIAYSTPLRQGRTDDYPFGTPPEAMESWASRVERGLMTHGYAPLSFVAPSRADDPQFREWWYKYFRSAVSPMSATRSYRAAFNSDIRSVVPLIAVPVLVLHRKGEDRVYPVEMSRDLVDRIPTAKLVELDGDDYLPEAGDVDAFVDEIEDFVTGTRPAREPDRVLATVLFTDLVDSTKLAIERGDARWRQILDRHDELVRIELARSGGRQIKTTGDGVLAIFDGPARAVRCACAIRDVLRGLDIEVRSGIHTGEIVLRGEDVAGVAVHIGQRVSALAGPSEVLVSRTVTDLVAGSGLEFEDRGEHELKGVPGRWQLYAVRA